MKTRIIILGPPCSGKSTLAEAIRKEMDIPQISVGKILRKHIKENTEFGKRVKKYVQNGELVPDELIAELVEKTLLQKACKKGFILDGFPRTMPQAKILREISRKISAPIDVVIHLKIPDELVINRVEGRRNCEDCGAKYNLFDHPPKNEHCDHCGGILVKSRDEDTVEVAQKRLKDYHEKTAPAIDYLSKIVLVKTFEDYHLDTLGKEVLNLLKIQKKFHQKTKSDQSLDWLRRFKNRYSTRSKTQERDISCK